MTPSPPRSAGSPSCCPPTAPSSAQVIASLRAPSSCTASPTSRPASSSRSTGSPRAARSTRRSTSCAGCRPSRRRRRLRASGCTSTSPCRSRATCSRTPGTLEFPFRRYQIQPAWRGERPQEGRYRQFTQADIDIVGRDELPFHHDVEVMRVMVEALDALPHPAGVLPVQQPQADPGLLPRPRRARRHRGDPDHRQARQAAGRAGRRAPGRATPARPRSRRSAASSWRRSACPTRPSSSGSARSASRTSCSTRGSPSSPRWSRAAPPRPASSVTVEANLRIARGLDYYTGTVVEIFMAGYERLKSVGGGGRYDALASDGRTTYPGVGVSFGVSRTLVPLLADGVARRQPIGARAPCSSRSSTRSRRPTSDAVADRAPRPRHPVRGRRQRRRSSASRSGTPSGAASRSSGSPAPTAPRGQGHPQRATRCRPTRRPGARREDLRPQIVSPQIVNEENP